jgi:hypothetical protein
MRRDDFVFCIGYEGSAAIVDGRQQRAHAGWSAVRLAEAGLFKPAVAAALFDGSDGDLEAVRALYNARGGPPAQSSEDLKRTFGTVGVPEGVKKVVVV